MSIRCTDCGADADAGRAGWMCRTCGAVLPSDRPDAKATGIAAKVARELGCADIDDVPDALKRVLADNADAEIHRRVLTEQSDAHCTRADTAEADRDAWRDALRACYTAASADPDTAFDAETTGAYVAESIRQLRDALDALARRLSNLLAVIHRDGGHYEAEHGAEKACADAEALVIALLPGATAMPLRRGHVTGVPGCSRSPSHWNGAGAWPPCGVCGAKANGECGGGR